MGNIQVNGYKLLGARTKKPAAPFGANSYDKEHEL